MAPDGYGACMDAFSKVMAVTIVTIVAVVFFAVLVMLQ